MRINVYLTLYVLRGLLYIGGGSLGNHIRKLEYESNVETTIWWNSCHICVTNVSPFRRRTVETLRDSQQRIPCLYHVCFRMFRSGCLFAILICPQRFLECGKGRIYTGRGGRDLGMVLCVTRTERTLLCARLAIRLVGVPKTILQRLGEVFLEELECEDIALKRRQGTGRLPNCCQRPLRLGNDVLHV